MNSDAAMGGLFCFLCVAAVVAFLVVSVRIGRKAGRKKLENDRRAAAQDMDDWKK